MYRNMIMLDWKTERMKSFFGCLLANAVKEVQVRNYIRLGRSYLIMLRNFQRRREILCSSRAI